MRDSDKLQADRERHDLQYPGFLKAKWRLFDADLDEIESPNFHRSRPAGGQWFLQLFHPGFGFDLTSSFYSSQLLWLIKNQHQECIHEDREKYERRVVQK